MKTALKPKKYVTDRRGQKVAVVIAIEDYKKILADIEELESIRAYDAAKASGDEAIPFQQAMREIERSRK
jgi:predicted DNA-binding antitoxin AbrB/MazE fold protein